MEGVEGGPDERWRGGLRLLGRGGGRSGNSRGEGTIAEGGGGGSIIGRLDAPAEAEEGAGRGSEHG